MYIKLIYKKNIEGNYFYDKEKEVFSFWDRLNDNTDGETPLEDKDETVLDKINKFLKLMMDVEKKVEEEYDEIKCEGEFVNYPTDKKCGFNAYIEKIYKITKPGFNCRHRAGYSERDFSPKCKLDEKCEEDRDCERGKCHTGTCKIDFECDWNKLTNCSKEGCDILNEHIGFDKYSFKDGRCRINSCNDDQYYNCDKEGCLNLGYKFEWYDNGTERDIADDRCIIRDLEEKPPRCNSLNEEKCVGDENCEWCVVDGVETCENIGDCPEPAPPAPPAPPASTPSCEKKTVGVCNTASKENCNNTYEKSDDKERLCEWIDDDDSCVRTDTECIEVTPPPPAPPPAPPASLLKEYFWIRQPDGQPPQCDCPFPLLPARSCCAPPPTCSQVCADNEMVCNGEELNNISTSNIKEYVIRSYASGYDFRDDICDSVEEAAGTVPYKVDSVCFAPDSTNPSSFYIDDLCESVIPNNPDVGLACKCKEPSWKCDNETKTCKKCESDDEVCYDTIDECEEECSPISWNCSLVTGNCEQIIDGLGEYSNEDDCRDACKQGCVYQAELQGGERRVDDIKETCAGGIVVGQSCQRRFEWIDEDNIARICKRKTVNTCGSNDDTNILNCQNTCDDFGVNCTDPPGSS